MVRKTDATGAEIKALFTVYCMVVASILEIRGCIVFVIIIIITIISTISSLLSP